MHELHYIVKEDCLVISDTELVSQNNQIEGNFYFCSDLKQEHRRMMRTQVNPVFCCRDGESHSFLVFRGLGIEACEVFF